MGESDFKEEKQKKYYLCLVLECLIFCILHF